MIVPALTFFRSPVGKYAIVAMAVFLAVGGVYLVGRSHGHEATEGRWRARVAAAEAKARETERKGAQIAETLRAEHAAEISRIQANREVITRIVPRYVTSKADANCPVTTGVVSVLNAAANGSELPATPDPSGTSVDDASGVALSQLTEVAAYNFSLANEFRREVITWRAWYKKESELYGLRGPVR